MSDIERWRFYNVTPVGTACYQGKTDAPEDTWVVRESDYDVVAEALRTVQRLVNIPPEAILDDAERVRRIKLVVDTSLAGVLP